MYVLNLKTFMYYVFLVIVFIFFAIYVSSSKRTTKSMKTIRNSKQPDMKYILQWTDPKTLPFQYMGVGRQGFIDRNCSYTNCYVTADKKYFSDYTQFEVIAYAGPQVRNYKKHLLPFKRSLNQKYVFVSLESPVNYPINKKQFDNFFNWTWTYRLDSDIQLGYVVVKDTEDKIIGPKITMHWMKHEDMLPASGVLKELLRGKKKAAAWFVSNCKTISKREDYVTELNKILQSLYNMSIDIYGKCGNLTCEQKYTYEDKKRNNEDTCLEMIRKNYFFYLSFENSFSEDYVTEKLRHALEYNAIPIVYGGANYSRFLPNGSYLNARELGVEKLAAKMNELINDFNQYTEYFRWTNHYRYHSRGASPKTDDYCSFCALLNHERKLKEITVYKNFRTWWNTNKK